jgi:uncharacterized membrane protein YadS
MILISSTKLAESLNGRANARLPSTIQRWTRRLPRLFLNSVIEGTALAIRQLPGMTTFSPMILSMVIGIVFHNVVGMAARAKPRVTSTLRWLPGIAIFPLGLQFTSSQAIEIGGGALGIVVATVRTSFAVTIWIGEASSPISPSSSRLERRSAAHRQSLPPIPMTKMLPMQSRV